MESREDHDRSRGMEGGTAAAYIRDSAQLSLKISAIQFHEGERSGIEAKGCVTLGLLGGYGEPQFAVPTEFGELQMSLRTSSLTAILLDPARVSDSEVAAKTVLSVVALVGSARLRECRLTLRIESTVVVYYKFIVHRLLEQIECTNSSEDGACPISDIEIVADNELLSQEEAETISEYLQAYYYSLRTVKSISNLPPNIANPEYMSAWIYELFEPLADTVTITKISPMDAGFEFSKRLIDSENRCAEVFEIKYEPSGKAWREHTCLIGKGVTFDAGGMALKPWQSQQLMKYDKIGAVMVAMATYTAAQLGLPVKISSYLVFCENLLRENSIKPGSVYKLGEDDHVEVNNPDGEGRLLMVDCLRYLKSSPNQLPDKVVTVATLTGDSFDAFGDVHLPYFTNCEANDSWVTYAASAAGEKVWKMPLDDEYGKYLRSGGSKVIKNYSSGPAKLITSACFIGNFAKGLNWVHLDMAGISVSDSSASGRPLLLLLNMLGFNTSKCKDNLDR